MRLRTSFANVQRFPAGLQVSSAVLGIAQSTYAKILGGSSRRLGIPDSHVPRLVRQETRVSTEMAPRSVEKVMADTLPFRRRLMAKKSIRACFEGVLCSKGLAAIWDWKL